jgi:hypothetical protein
VADTAFQTSYRQEYIAGFEQRQSLLRAAVTTEAVIKGNSAVFLIADSGGASTVTRGVNGLIPARADNLTQVTCTLTEEHDLVRKTGFNVFASQGDQRRIMQETSMGVVNRKTDSQIITQLNTGTVTPSATAAIMSLQLVTHAKAILGTNEVPFDGNIWGLLTPAAESYLMQVKEFGSADYVTSKPLQGSNAAWADRQGYYVWMGINWIVHPNLPGVGTSAEKCFLFHKNAIGHAIDTGGMSVQVGYDDEQDYSFARTSAYMGAKLLQNSGIVVINHDGSALAAA